MTCTQFFIFTAWLVSCNALKIAISEGGGEGEGDGSAPLSQSQRTALADATGSLESEASTSPTSSAEATVNTPSGKVRAKVEQDETATFSAGLTVSTTADAANGISETTSVTFSAAAAAAVVAKITTSAGAAPVRVETVLSTPAAATGEGMELLIKGCDAAGVCTEIDISDLDACFTFTLPKTIATDDTCGYIDEADGLIKTTGVTTTGDSGNTLTCCTTHATPFGSTSSSSGGSGGASGDPKASNLAGQRFEILQLGTFSLLSVKEQGQASNRLSLDATIDRAGEMCGATYIKNVTMAGSWMQTSVRVRAAPEAVKLKALEIAFGGDDWIKAPVAKTQSPQVTKADKKNIHFDVHGVQIKISIDAHRIREHGVKTNNFANFLNVNVNGLKGVRAKGVHLGGLLAYDDHSFATTEPDGCHKGNLMNFKVKLESDATKFISSMIAN